MSGLQMSAVFQASSSGASAEPATAALVDDTGRWPVPATDGCPPCPVDSRHGLGGAPRRPVRRSAGEPHGRARPRAPRGRRRPRLALRRDPAGRRTPRRDRRRRGSSSSGCPTSSDPLSASTRRSGRSSSSLALVGAVAIGESVGASARSRGGPAGSATASSSAADRTAGAALGAAQAILDRLARRRTARRGPAAPPGPVREHVHRDPDDRDRPAATDRPRRRSGQIPRRDRACRTCSSASSRCPRRRSTFRTTRRPGRSRPPPRRAPSRSRPPPADSQSVGTGFAVGSGLRRDERPRRGGCPGGRDQGHRGRRSRPRCRAGLLRPRARRRAAPRRPAARRSPLQWAAKDPERGALGATLGYPGGRALTILPAAVTSRYPPPDATSTAPNQVRREILELRAQIEPGDSGGPLVLADGTVGGVVFAEAKSDPDVGYALAPRTSPTLSGSRSGGPGRPDTGDCVR